MVAIPRGPFGAVGAGDMSEGFFAEKRRLGLGYRRLDEDRVRVIKRELADGKPVREVALSHRMSERAIYEIRSGVRWGQVDA